jgi:hypothetical protein
MKRLLLLAVIGGVSILAWTSLVSGAAEPSRDARVPTTPGSVAEVEAAILDLDSQARALAHELYGGEEVDQTTHDRLVWEIFDLQVQRTALCETLPLEHSFQGEFC